MTDMDRMAVAQSLGELRDSVVQTTNAMQEEIQRKRRSYYRGAVAASVIVSVLISISLVLVTNDDQKRFADIKDELEKMSRNIEWFERRDAQGLRGEPPMSWTVTEADGSLTTCERAEGFDPASPRYRCSPGAR